MLSHGLRQVLEGLPGRIPLVIEVLDRSLTVVMPDSSYRPFPLIDLTSDLREQLLAAHSTRPHTIHQRGQRIDVYPIAGPADRGWSLLLAIGGDEADLAMLNAWGPLLRSALEADLATAGEVSRYSQQARHLGAVLRFVGYIAGTHSDNELLRAILQAAAVWFDLDARIYKREPGGDFVPHIHLPGTVIVPGKRIPAATVDGTPECLRLTSVADLEAFGLSGEGGAALIPVGGPRPDMLLVLTGTLPADVEVTFGAIAKVAARILQGGHGRTAPIPEGKPLIAAFTEPAVSAEQTFTRLLRSLVDMTGAAGGSVTARVRDESRVIVSLGEVEASGVSSEHLSLSGTGGAELSVTIDLVSGDARFDAAARGIADQGSDLLRVWLSGPGSRDAVRRAVWGARVDRTATFVTRIEEEIARAKRFHLDLALIVVRTEVEEDAGRMEELQKYVRAELRDSDVLAPINNVEIAALLIHTNDTGASAVVRRLQRRLTDDPSWKGAASVGHASFSPEFATPSALLAAARVPAAPARPKLTIMRDTADRLE